MAARKDKNARDRELLNKRRAGFLAALDKMGVRKEFERLPLGLRTRMYVRRLRPVTVQLDPAVAGGAAATELKREIEDVLNLPLLDVMGNGGRLSFKEVWWVLVTLWATLGPPGNPEGLTAEVGRAMGPVSNDDAMAEVLERIGREVEMRSMMRAMQLSRLDLRVYGVRIRDRKTKDPFDAVKEVLVYGDEPRRRVFEVEGVGRPAYQVGVGVSQAGVIWAEWEPQTVGRAPGPRLPVFVQGHTMQRLMERTPGERGEQKRGALHMMLCESLFHPNVVQHDDAGRSWVELRGFNRERLGYLLAEFVDGAVLVKTYQFLTMHGSPEATRLYRRLGARRADFEYLRLDQLATFVETDVAGDAELRRIFEECGCGHLFDLRRMWEWPESTDTQTAAWVRGYLNIRPATGMAAA